MTPRNDIVAIAGQIDACLLPDTKTWVNRFEVHSRTSDSKYVVAQRRSDDTWGCSCWAWRRNRRCPHLTDVLGRLAVVAKTNTKVYGPHVQKMLAGARTAFLDLDAKPLAVALPQQRGRQVDLT